jgi:signal transduction histidine kinase
MQNNADTRLSGPFMMDISVYGTVAVMALLGISGLPSLALQIAAGVLCLIFALLYRFLFHTDYYKRNPALYFGPQAVVMMLLFLLQSGASDAFNFLFFILTVQAAVALDLGAAIAWTALYFSISSAAVLFSRGLDGLFAVFFYLVAFVVCVILGHTIRQAELTSERNQRLVDELRDTQQKLQELAVVEERNRLARDLHDSVKQQVFAISMQLSAARTALTQIDKAYSSVVEAERLAQQAGTELTALINALRPAALESKTLASAVREQIEEFSRRNKIDAETRIDPAIMLDPRVEQALFRVVQEALANVARHSGASHVQVSLQEETDRVVLTVEDNGSGFDMGRNKKGVGLDSMKERLMAVDGVLEVTSENSKGTRLTATVRRL